MVLKTTRGR